MSLKDVKDMDLAELFERFSKDILFGCHSTRAEYCRSEAQKELLDARASHEIMTHIASHVQSGHHLDGASNKLLQGSLEEAWTYLVKDMCSRLEFNMEESPNDLDLPSWIAWAEAQITALEKSGV